VRQASGAIREFAERIFDDATDSGAQELDHIRPASARLRARLSRQSSRESFQSGSLMPNVRSALLQSSRE